MRPSYRMSGCPRVQDFWRKVRAVRPGDRPDLRVNSHLCENVRVAERREHPRPVPYMGQVHVTRQAIRERQPEPVVAQHLDVGHVIEGRATRWQRSLPRLDSAMTLDTRLWAYQANPT